MPLYEFECRNCQTVFEELVRSGNTGEGVSCPSCGGQEVGKKMSTFAGRMGKGKVPEAPAGCADGSCPMRGSCGLN